MPPGNFVGVDPAAEVAALRSDTSGAEPASSEAFDVVVLGGGLAGLCAAHRLAKRGVKRVVLLEAADRSRRACVAPCTQCIDRGSRFPAVFNVHPQGARRPRTLQHHSAHWQRLLS